MERTTQVRGTFEEGRWASRFRRMMRIFTPQSIPKTLKAPGFKDYLSIGGVVYLVKHGTNYRLDLLLASGRASIAAA